MYLYLYIKYTVDQVYLFVFSHVLGICNYAEGGATEVYCNRAVCPSVCLSFMSLAKN